MNPRILIADGEETPREELCWFLRKEGFRVTSAEDSFEALGVLLNRPIAVVVVDAALPPTGGLELVTNMENEDALQSVPVVMMARPGTPPAARRDLIVAPKPPELPRLLDTVRVLTGVSSPGPDVAAHAYRVQLAEKAGRQFRAFAAERQADVRTVIDRVAAAAATVPPGTAGDLDVEDTGEYQVFYFVDHSRRRIVVRDIALRWGRC